MIMQNTVCCESESEDYVCAQDNVPTANNYVFLHHKYYSSDCLFKDIADYSNYWHTCTFHTIMAIIILIFHTTDMMANDNTAIISMNCVLRHSIPTSL